MKTIRNSNDFKTGSFSFIMASGEGELAASTIASKISQTSSLYYASVSNDCASCVEIISKVPGYELSGSTIQVSNTNYVNHPLTILKEFTGEGMHPRSGEVVESRIMDHTIIAGGRIGVLKLDKVLTGSLEASSYHSTTVGQRYYEIKNWLGSVISVVKDIKFKKDGNTEQEEDFNTGTYKSTQWNMDSVSVNIAGSAPEQQLSVQTANQGDAVEYIIQTEAGKEYTVQFTLGDVEMADKLKVESRNVDPSDPLTNNQLITYNSISSDGTYSIHFTAQKDEVRVRFLTDATNGGQFTIDDVKVTTGGHYEAVVAQSTDYYPYGMQMKGRGRTGKYAYGYQGSRSVDEVEGEGNTYTTEFRQLDSRLGIWRSPDPVFQPWQSPYNSMDGNPINLTDAFGNCTDCKSEGLKEGDVTQDGDGSLWTFMGKDENGDGNWEVAGIPLPEVVINAKKKAPSDLNNKLPKNENDNTGLSPKHIPEIHPDQSQIPNSKSDDGSSFGDWIRDLESVFGGVMVWGDGKAGGRLIGSDRGGATSSFDVNEFKELVGLVNARLSGKSGKGITASQEERIEELKKAFEEKLKGLIPGVKLSNEQKADLIVQTLVEAAKILDEVDSQVADQMQADSRAVFNSEKIVKAPVVDFGNVFIYKYIINESKDSIGTASSEGSGYYGPGDTMKVRVFTPGGKYIKTNYR